MFRHIRWRLLATYLVVIFLALSFLGVHLTRDSEARYLAQVEFGLLAQARLIALHLAAAVAAGDAGRTQAELQGTGVPGNPAVVVVDRAGRRLAVHEAETRAGAAAAAVAGGLARALRGEEATGSERTDGVPVVFGAVPVRYAGEVAGAVFIGLPLSALADQIRHIRVVVGVTILVTMVWATLVSLILAQRLAGPIQEMQAATTRLAAGDLSQRVPVRTRDELGALAQSLNAMAAELERLDAMRREFVADASHELRTPVANLAVATEALRASLPQPSGDAAALLDSIEHEVGRLRGLVETLLDLSAIESTRVRLHIVPADLREVVREVLRSFQPRAARQRIALELVEPPHPVVARVDPDRMTQVLNNLLDNALKFTPPEGRVTVRVVEERDRVALTVEDTGPGIPPADLPHIFDRFFKADRSRSGRQGAGLGLAIARALVRAQGGRLAAENCPEAGARFTVILPAS